MRTNRYTMSIHDPTGKRLCTLFDSTIAQDGSAYSIKLNKELSGWKTLEFTLNFYDMQGNDNYRCEYAHNENYVYVYEDDELDIYCIKSPAKSHDKSVLSFVCTANHISEELKTRNLYRYFDDENGIDTCQALIEKAIRGSGWTLGQIDTFLEPDGTTEKIRSYKCDTKTGTYNMIAGICDLFNARPVFHGGTRTVDILSKENTSGFSEIMFGNNMDKIQRTPKSDTLITRLYVEGEYGDFGYVGIDDVNPTGLPFILNFDYYKEIGVFTDEHQEIVDQYLVDYKEVSDNISEQTTQQLEKNARLFELIGTTGYVLYQVVDGYVDVNSRIVGGGISENDQTLHVGDKVMLINSDWTYSYADYTTTVAGEASYLAKFIPGVGGLIAVKEDVGKAAESSLETNLKNLNKFLQRNGYQSSSVNLTYDNLVTIYATSDLTIVKDPTYNLNRLQAKYKISSVLDYVVAIGTSHNTITSSESEKQELIMELVDTIYDIDSIQRLIDSYIEEQEVLNDNFIIAMGTMLKDGYWSDDKYVPGQEAALYEDAVRVSDKMAHPVVSYTITTRDTWKDFELAQAIHIYDEYAKINDYGVITKATVYVDKPESDTYTVDPDLIDVGNKTFASILERTTQMAEKLRQNQDKYERAASISADGTFRTDMLSGAIDVMRTQILSSASNWRTDAAGNIVLESLDGRCAMMLSGTGFMIANSKLDNGDWEWRTFGTGDGFTADMITTGFLSADRIEANSIQVDKLSSSVGANLDLSSNNTVNITASKINQIADQINFTSNDSIISLVEGSDSFTEVRQTADKISWVIKEPLTSTSSTFEFTPHAISAMSDNIEITAERINAVASDINFSAGNESIMELAEGVFQTQIGNSSLQATTDKINLLVADGSTEGKLELTSDALEAIANNINLQANDSIKLIVGAVNDLIRMNFDFTATGLIIQKKNSDNEIISAWSNTIDNGGYKITNSNSSGFDGNGTVFKATPDGVISNGYECGELRVRKSSAGGWIWTDKM